MSVDELCARVSRGLVRLAKSGLEYPEVGGMWAVYIHPDDLLGMLAGHEERPTRIFGLEVHADPTVERGQPILRREVAL